MLEQFSQLNENRHSMLNRCHFPFIEYQLNVIKIGSIANRILCLCLAFPFNRNVVMIL